MSQLDENDFNNIEVDALSPLFFSSEYIPKEINEKQFSYSNTQIKDNKLLNFENIKNIFEEETLNLNKSEEEDCDKSVYFIKKQDNLDTESRSTENSTNSILDQEKCLKNKKEDSSQKIINFKTFLKKSVERSQKKIIKN